jgi:hypothetical protein
MPYDLSLDELTGILRARFYGSVDAAEAWRGVAAVRRHLEDALVAGILLDVRESSYAPSVDEVRNFAIEFVSFLGRSRLAFVTRSEAQDARARSLADQAASRGIDVRVFQQNEQEALSWLQSVDEL